ncbi:hypothetical protein COR50_04870 [Chitinophaga caeni]|uniref:Uncharacterized protein n=1 Tax=Chitinophaga caeni TaxID=2029983 RepID=A0A291QRV0_9BACT|nr:hypothetical protein [Chitinophaga caeni]ATL46564.1 hypothetical protein COR50_04870 [Chitinophaga caeni]
MNINIPIPLIAPILTFFLGIISGLFFERYKNRLIFLREKLIVRHVALGGQVPGGNIQILYNGQVSNNLYSVYLELKNDNNVDLDAFSIHLTVNEGATIFENSAQLLQNNTYRALKFEKEFNNTFNAVFTDFSDVTRERSPAEQRALQNGIDYITRNRIYEVPYLNRKAKLEFSFLIDSRNGEPSMVVTPQKKGIETIYEQADEQRIQLRKLWIGIISCTIFMISLYPIIIYSPSVSWAVWVTTVSSIICYLVAWPIFYFCLWVKKNVFLRG